MKFQFPLASVLFICCCSAPTEKIPPIINETAAHRIDSTLRSFVQDSIVAGASALIFEKGKEVYFGAFGFSDLENRKPMARNTVVQIFSMTKPVTGTALMTLYEKNAFTLDEPVSKYIPEFDSLTVFNGLDENGNVTTVALDRPITIRDLTRHTSGFATDRNQPGLGQLITEADAGNKTNTLSQMAEKMATVPLAFQPGTQWLYGPSVDVQALLVERISGIPYGDYVQSMVIAPLGMNETQYVVPETLKDRMSALYRRDENSKLIRLPDDQAFAFNYEKWPLTPGGFGLTSTLDDYMKFAQMLVNKGTYKDVKILNPETVELMRTDHLPDSITERSWLPSKGQVGWGIDFAVRHSPPVSTEENNGVVGEFFWDGAASTLFWVDPVNELTVVFFVQVFPFTGSLHKKIRDAVYGPVSLPASEVN